MVFDILGLLRDNAITRDDFFYGIDGMGEAKAYMEHPVLRERLLEITHVLLTLKSSDLSRVMGYPDDLKLKSSMTLFAEATPECLVFEQVLNKFFHGEKDQKTLGLLYGKKRIKNDLYSEKN